jgi:hypothetical protein
VVTKLSLLTFLLGAFAKLRKAAIHRVFLLRHGRTRLPLDGFLWNLIFEHFSKSVSRKFNFCENLSTTGTLLQDVCSFMTISCWIILRMRSISDKPCRENQNTILCPITLFRSSCVCEIIWKTRYSRTGHRWQNKRMCFACWITTPTHTRTILVAPQCYVIRTSPVLIILRAVFLSNMAPCKSAYSYQHYGGVATSVSSVTTRG